MTDLTCEAKALPPEKSNIQWLLAIFMGLGLIAIFAIGAIGWWASSDLTKTVNSIGEDSLSLAKVNIALSNTAARYLDRHEGVATAQDQADLADLPNKPMLLAEFSEIYSQLNRFLSQKNLVEAEKFIQLQREFDQLDTQLLGLKQQYFKSIEHKSRQLVQSESSVEMLITQAQAIEQAINDYQRATALEDEKRFFGGQSKEGKQADQLSQLVVNSGFDNSDSNILVAYLKAIHQASEALATADSKEQLKETRAQQIQPKYDAILAVLKELIKFDVPIDNYQDQIEIFNANLDQWIIQLMISDESLAALQRGELDLVTSMTMTRQTASVLSTRLLSQLEVLTQLSDEVGQRAREKADFVVKKTQDLTLMIAGIIIVVFLVFGRLIIGKIGALMTRLREHASRLQLAHDEIDHAHKELQDSNRVVTESIYYASKIQRAILTSKEAIGDLLGQDNYFALWQPRDVVGGDMFWIKPWGRGQLIALADCTGHGVPGAFMTILAKSALDQAMATIPAGCTAQLAASVHSILQSDLGQDSDEGDSDDGLDLALLYIPDDRQSLTYTGARMNLLIQTDEGIEQVKGDRLSIGYRNLPSELAFKEHQLALSDHQRLFLYTDGYTDQVGGDKRIGFGLRRLKLLLEQLKSQPIAHYEAALWSRLNDYQLDEERRDDVTVLGVEVNRHSPS